MIPLFPSPNGRDMQIEAKMRRLWAQKIVATWWRAYKAKMEEEVSAPQKEWDCCPRASSVCFACSCSWTLFNAGR